MYRSEIATWFEFISLFSVCRSLSKSLSSTPFLCPLSSLGAPSLLGRAQCDFFRVRLCFLRGLQMLWSFLRHLGLLGYINAIVIVIVIFIFIFIVIPISVVFTPTPIPRETPECACALRLLLLCQDCTVCVRLYPRPCPAPASAEEREAHVGTVMREDPRAELRIVSRTDYVCRCAAHEFRLLFIWLYNQSYDTGEF
jgi:hypothetical protein